MMRWISLVLVAACSAGAPTPSSPAPVSQPAAVPSPGAPSSPAPPAAAAGNEARLIVSFFSLGDGTDHEAGEKLRDWLEGRDDLGVRRADWGMEGETDYCFALTALSAAEQAALVAEVKTLLADSKKVNYFEHQPCREGR